MKRRILIIDDNDDLATSLDEVFAHFGHMVQIVETREAALDIDDIEKFDIVITDLDVDSTYCESAKNGRGGGAAVCLPSAVDAEAGEHIKAFKFCATNFRRDALNEEELKNFIATVLDYKLKYVDRSEYVQGIHESIEFELPSVISVMHIVLDYLVKRVERLGVIDPTQSNLFVALDEAFVNAVKHGNKFDHAKLVRITAQVSRHEARFTVEDEGEGFDVSTIPDPLDPGNLFKTSGRGVLFIYNIMDEVIYNERGNRLTMVKKKSDQ